MSVEVTGEPAEAVERPDIETLFRRHQVEVLGIVRRMLGPRASAADVDDVTQLAFIHAHRGLHGYRGDAPPRAWLYRIATRAVLMHHRSLGRRWRALQAYVRESLTSPQSSPSPERHLESRQELEQAWAALDRMRPAKRMVFLMHEIEGLSGKEIAEALDIEEATVWTRLFHARRELVAAVREAP